MTLHAKVRRRIAAPLFLVMLLALLAALPALAGEKPADYEACDQPLEFCLTEMVKKIRAKGWVGIEIAHQDDGSFLVTSVFPESPAAAGGLRAGDYLLALDGVYYATAGRTEIKKAYQAMKPGRTIVYTVRRGDRSTEVPITLARVPEHVLAQWMGRHLLQGHGQQAMVEKERGGDS